MRAEDVMLEFNECISRGALEALALLMTDDHVLTDTLGASVNGKQACLDAWRGFFQAFPDYRNTFEQIRTRGDLAVAIGYSTCSVEALDGPAIWTALVAGPGVAHWRVNKDRPEVRAELDL